MVTRYQTHSISYGGLPIRFWRLLKDIYISSIAIVLIFNYTERRLVAVSGRECNIWRDHQFQRNHYAQILCHNCLWLRANTYKQRPPNNSEQGIGQTMVRFLVLSKCVARLDLIFMLLASRSQFLLWWDSNPGYGHCFRFTCFVCLLFFFLNAVV